MLVLVSTAAAAQTATPAAPVYPHEMRIVTLGTGTPYQDPDRFGQSTAVVVNGVPYLVDAGPAVMRRVAQAAAKNIAPGLNGRRIGAVFLTHLHSDHTVGLPDVMLSPAVVGRPGALDVYGPAGTTNMVQSILKAYEKDIDIRLHGLEAGNAKAYVVRPHEIKAGIIYKDDNVTVTAFPVKHGTWDESWGYRFNGDGKSVVFSGDTAPTATIAQACNGCDVLIHEVYPQAGLLTQKEPDRPYHRAFHTSTAELAAIAIAAKPKLLVLDHILFWGVTPQGVIDEVKAAGYTGRVVVANDLDVF